MIRKISAGVVFSFGPAATFSGPSGIVHDAANSRPLVADTNNHCIRALALSGGAVSTLAGACGTFGNSDGFPAQARFNTPRGLALAGTALYIVDSGNHRIRKLSF